MLDTAVFLTSCGYMAIQYSEYGLWSLTFPKVTKEKALADKLLQPYEKVYFPENSVYTKELMRLLNLYFGGTPVSFNLPIDWRGYTAFQSKVLKMTASLAYGTIDTYGGIAAKIGSPKAFRAVGGALNINRTPIIVPCHRVIGANGRLTGFAGGLTLKEKLLALEKNNY